MLADLRLAVRSLRRQPALLSATVATLALAVAVNTALFSIFDGLLFRPLPYPDADRLVHVEIAPAARPTLTPEAFRQVNEAMVGSAVLVDRAEARPAVIVEEGAADVGAWRLRPAHLTPNVFALLGVVPAAGRTLGPDDAYSRRPSPIMIGYDLWRTRFGGDRNLIGQPIAVPGLVIDRPLLLVGVMPRGFAFPDGANLWILGNSRPELFNLARLAPGVTLDQARAALPRVAVTPIRDHLRPDGAFALGVLLAATGLLLVVAWVQVAALLFARTAARMTELGVRLALGAGRARLVRQLSAEGIVLAAAAVALGWLVVPALTSGIVTLLPEEMTRGQGLAPDLRALAFSCAASIAGVLFFMLLPIEVVRRASPLGLIRQGSVVAPSRSGTRVRAGLLAAQFAVTMALLYMASLSAASLGRVTSVELGFDPANVVGVRMPAISVVGATNAERRAHIVRQQAQSAETLAAIARLPGVRAAAGGPIPFYESLFSSGLPRAVTVPGSQDPLPPAAYHQITRDYLAALGLRLVDGRLPAEDELAAGAQTALVNETLAREIARSGPVVGRPIEILGRKLVVAGVVNDAVGRRPDLPVEPQVLHLGRTLGPELVVKTAEGVEGDRALAAIRSTLERIWPDRAAREIVDVVALARQATMDYRARAVLLGLIGAMCLPLAIAGIAGAATHAVRQRMREIGIRMALGAEPGRIGRDVAAPIALVIGSGLALGVAGGWAMGRLMSAYLFGVGAASLSGFAAAALVLVLAGAAGAALPLRRALRIQPAQALREA